MAIKMKSKKEMLWNFQPLIKEDFNSLRNKIINSHKSFVDKWKNKSYLNDNKKLKEALDDFENLRRNFYGGGSEYFYYNLSSYVYQDKPEIKSGLNKALEFVNEMNDKVRFFILSISKIDKKAQDKILGDPIFRDYQHFLERCFEQGAHLLSNEEEKILNLKDKVCYENWEKLVSEFLAKSEREIKEGGKKVSKNFNELSGLLRSQDNKFREEVSEAFDSVVLDNLDLAVFQINSLLENKKVDDKLRNFKRPDSARHLDDDIDKKVVDILLKVVSSKYGVSKRFYELKAKVLGIPKFEYNDRNIEYFHIEKKYSFDDAVKIVREVFGDIDREFLDIFDMFLKNGQIDVFPRKAKRDGAFCSHYLLTNPTYIMLNFNQSLNDITTIAHEVGHGINNELMRKKQNSLYFDTPKSTAEVASTFMEDFVFERLMKDADDEGKFSLIMGKLQNDVQTIFRQVACYKFEQELHDKFNEKGYLSGEEIGRIFENNISAYLGDSFRKSESMKMGWVYWPHIRDYFYVYSYASGLLISKYMQSRFKEDKKFIAKIKEFLSTGTSKSPKDIFSDLGIDITREEFWIEGIKETEDLLKKAEELAKKLGKIK